MRVRCNVYKFVFLYTVQYTASAPFNEQLVKDFYEQRVFLTSLDMVIDLLSVKCRSLTSLTLSHTPVQQGGHGVRTAQRWAWDLGGGTARPRREGAHRRLPAPRRACSRPA